jgi:hypothetical protein
MLRCFKIVYYIHPFYVCGGCSEKNDLDEIPKVANTKERKIALEERRVSVQEKNLELKEKSQKTKAPPVECNSFPTNNYSSSPVKPISNACAPTNTESCNISKDNPSSSSNPNSNSTSNLNSSNSENEQENISIRVLGYLESNKDKKNYANIKEQIAVLINQLIANPEQLNNSENNKKIIELLIARLPKTLSSGVESYTGPLMKFIDALVVNNPNSLNQPEGYCRDLVRSLRDKNKNNMLL